MHSKVEHAMDGARHHDTGNHAHSINASTTAAMIIAAAGVKVAKHGNRAASSKGAAPTASGTRRQPRPAARQVVEELEKIGICFMFAQKYHASMKYVGAIRKGLGIRTVPNRTACRQPQTRMILGVSRRSAARTLLTSS